MYVVRHEERLPGGKVDGHVTTEVPSKPPSLIVHGGLPLGNESLASSRHER